MLEPISKTKAIVLCLFLGGLGIHRKAMGYSNWKIQALVTVFTCGFGVVWSLVDLVKIINGNMKMSNGSELL